MRSLDAPVHDEEDASASAGDLIGSDDEEFDRVEAGVTLERLTGILDDRAREILRLRFPEDLLQSEIAERVGCSQMHVSRIIRSSLEKLYAYGSGMQGRGTVPSTAPSESGQPIVPDEPATPAVPAPDREAPATQPSRRTRRRRTTRRRRSRRPGSPPSGPRHRPGRLEQRARMLSGDLLTPGALALVDQVEHRLLDRAAGGSAARPASTSAASHSGRSMTSPPW